MITTKIIKRLSNLPVSMYLYDKTVSLLFIFRQISPVFLKIYTILLYAFVFHSESRTFTAMALPMPNTPACPTLPSAASAGHTSHPRSAVRSPALSGFQRTYYYLQETAREAFPRSRDPSISSTPRVRLP